MVELGEGNGTSSDTLDHLSVAINDALTSGVTTEEILTMVQTAAQEATQTCLPGVSPEDRHCPIYTELPPGLIDLPKAAKKYGLNVRTVHHWVSKGHLVLAGRLKAPATGGGYLVVSESELESYMQNPRPRGRPKSVQV